MRCTFNAGTSYQAGQFPSRRRQSISLRGTMLIVVPFSLVATSIYIPLGHRTYSYKDIPVPSLENFNRLQGGKQISIANAYGGWFTKEISSEAVVCNSNTSNTTNDLPQIRVHNSFSHAVTVLTCSSDGCSGHDPGVCTPVYVEYFCSLVQQAGSVIV